MYVCVFFFVIFGSFTGAPGYDPSLAEAGGTCWVVSRLVT